MTSPEKHYDELINAIRGQRVTPAPHLRERFLSDRPVRSSRIMLLKKWSIAASLALVAAISWVLVQHNRSDVLAFPDGISVEQFNDQTVHIEAVYQVDANFNRLKHSYR